MIGKAKEEQLYQIYQAKYSENTTNNVTQFNCTHYAQAATENTAIVITIVVAGVSLINKVVLALLESFLICSWLQHSLHP